MINNIKYTKILLIILVSIYQFGCSSYGRGGSQVDVVEVNENKALNLVNDVNRLEQKIAELNNQVEIQEYEIDRLTRRTQIQQSELDRLYRTQGQPGYTYIEPTNNPSINSSTIETYPQPSVNNQNTNPTGANSGITSEPIITQPTDPQSIPTTTTPEVANVSVSAQQLYNNGFEQLKQGDYPKSINTFNQLLERHPNSSFADDAQYWTGEAYYVNREFQNALRAFNKVITLFPSSDRAADALLRIGYIHYEQGDIQNARNIFNKIITRYPNERVSDFARERLTLINNQNS